MSNKVELKLDGKDVLENLRDKVSSLTDQAVKKFWDAPDNPWGKRPSASGWPWDDGTIKPAKYAKEEKRREPIPYKLESNILYISLPGLTKDDVELQISTENNCNAVYLTLHKGSYFLPDAYVSKTYTFEFPSDFLSEPLSVNLSNGVLSIAFERKAYKSGKKKLDIV